MPILYSYGLVLPPSAVAAGCSGGAASSGIATWQWFFVGHIDYIISLLLESCHHMETLVSKQLSHHSWTYHRNVWLCCLLCGCVGLAKSWPELRTFRGRSEISRSFNPLKSGTKIKNTDETMQLFQADLWSSSDFRSNGMALLMFPPDLRKYMTWTGNWMNGDQISRPPCLRETKLDKLFSHHLSLCCEL